MKPAPPTAAVAPAAVQPSSNPAAQAIDRATWSSQAPPEQLSDVLIRVQALLQRAHFSPGEIDGKDGGNLKTAVAAFEQAHNLPVDGLLDDQVWTQLSRNAGPVMTDYVIAAEDVQGPFVAEIPKEMADQAKLDHLAYKSPLEGLAEKFHMSPELLQALNPGADFARAGSTIVVVAPGAADLPAKVARVEVDKSRLQARAYGADGALLAVYPATVGSEDRPAPSGTWEVRAVAPEPTYTYDPSRLTFGKKSAGKLTIKAGPNNPVGATWIDLTKETYGIHGTPDPSLVGKVASHGCVRLTNWDVAQLGRAVEKGAKVVFVGSEGAGA
ncbi:L,D-transpeptidase family protein [Phenylobacterium deserti]|uniref:L,D-transpeptidase family protein n=1 Tax=Phenylobacterium deserti TaxID=1914756 RepID=UPI001F0CA421|nr:L,D-transpeptidase [Phenylobacterium deserti]